MNKKRVDAYQHTRNKNCIYRRVGDTDKFTWEGYTRAEYSLIRDMEVDGKFEPYEEKNNG